MVQDIAPHTFCNEFSHRPASGGDFVLCFEGDGVLLHQEGDAVHLPTLSALREVTASQLQFLFLEDERGFYLLEGRLASVPAGFAFVASRDYRNATPLETVFACGVGETLRRWYGGNRFCGRCGRPMVKSETERAMVCPSCQNTVYPKICPAVIVAICDGDRLLLTKYAGRAFARYALVAGFAEIGEPIEATVRREVLEEVGLSLGELRFYKSQPWVFTDSLLMGFYAALDGPDTVTLQESELAEATWFQREALPQDLLGISLTGEMIDRFRRGCDPFSLEKTR